MSSSAAILQHLVAEHTEGDPDDAWRLKLADRLALANSAWFGALSPPVRHDLLRTIRVRSYASREEIFAAGAPACAWRVCLTGAVRLATPARDGRALAMQILGAGRWFGDLPTSAAAVHTHRASAVGTTRIGEIDRQAMCALTGRYPEFHAAVLDWQARCLNSVIRLLEEHTTVHLATRIARQLHRLARDHGVPQGGEIRIALALRQTELAELLGCSRQRANKHMVELARRGIVRYEEGSYIVANPGALSQSAAAIKKVSPCSARC